MIRLIVLILTLHITIAHAVPGPENSGALVPLSTFGGHSFAEVLVLIFGSSKTDPENTIWYKNYQVLNHVFSFLAPKDHPISPDFYARIRRHHLPLFRFFEFQLVSDFDDLQSATLTFAPYVHMEIPGLNLVLTNFEQAAQPLIEHEKPLKEYRNRIILYASGAAALSFWTWASIYFDKDALWWLLLPIGIVTFWPSVRFLAESAYRYHRLANQPIQFSREALAIMLRLFYYWINLQTVPVPAVRTNPLTISDFQPDTEWTP